MEHFLPFIQEKMVLRDEEVRMFWMVSKSGKFSVKFLFSVLKPGDPFLFPWSIIWSSYVPPKVTFFAWKVTWGKALTLDLVQMRGVLLPNRCFLCHFEEETIDHILLHCARAKESLAIVVYSLWDFLGPPLLG